MDKQLAQQLSELKAQMALISTAIERIDQKVHEPETQPQSPLWAKLASDHSVPLSKVFEATKIWDADDFEEWTTNWNKSKRRRVALLNEVLQTWQAEIKTRQPPPINAKINSVDQAEAIVSKIREFKDYQNQLVDYVCNYDLSTLDELCQVDHATDFKTYYDWINHLLSGVGSFKLPCDTDQLDAKTELYSQITQVLHQLLSQIDTEIIPNVQMIDPVTFEPKDIPAEVQPKYKKRVLNIYKEDLRRAFEYLVANK